MSSIGNRLKSVWQAIVNLPSLIIEGISTFLQNIYDAITGLPTVIFNGIKAIFVPDENAINEAFNSFIEELKFKFAFDTEFFENLFESETPVEDIYVDYSISGVGDFKFKVLDVSLLKVGIEYFRPVIRGFLVLLLFFYHIRQLIGFFGYDAGVVAGRSEWIAYNKANTGGHKDE